jgi:hypothetical protein
MQCEDLIRNIEVWWMRSRREWIRSGREWMRSGREWMRSGRVVDEIYRLERLTANGKVTTVLGSIPASSDTVESEGRQMKQF